MATHELKTLAPFYDAVKSGEKTFELRKNYDRQFQKGDLLRLVKTNRFGKPVGGEVIEKQVSYVLSGFDGIESGYVILGLQDVTKAVESSVDLDALGKLLCSLKFIDPDESNDIWTTVGLALRNEGLPFEVFVLWSQLGKKVKTAKECLVKWNSFS